VAEDPAGTSLTWDEVARRLARPANYWLGTTGDDGAPRAVPMWGVVLDNLFYLYAERRSVKARHMAAEPRVVVHPESAEDVLIVRGTVDDLGPPGRAPAVVAAFAEKYPAEDDAPYLPSAERFDVLYALRPTNAITWLIEDPEGTTRRWRVDAP